VGDLTGVSHLGLTVRNLRASEDWYTRVFRLERVHAERGPHSESVVLRDPESEMVIGLRHHYGAGAARFDETRTGLDHVSFGVPDQRALDDWVERLHDLGIEHSPVAETEFGWVLVLRDPDHIQLELFCRRRPALRVTEDMPGVADATESAPEAPEQAPLVPVTPMSADGAA
jgi:catechol 2,3-dioxygenase-like lactoylglutathione lyase family enzyme